MGSEGQDFERHERVVEHEVGLGEGAHRAHGEQLRVARPGADELCARLPVDAQPTVSKPNSTARVRATATTRSL